MSWQTIAPSLALIPVSSLAIAIADGGSVYFVLVCTLTAGLFFYSCRLAIRKSNLAARRLLVASIICLPCVFLLTALGSRDWNTNEVGNLTKPAQRLPVMSTLNSHRLPR